MITNKELDRLQKLCDAATPGPWVRSGGGHDVCALDVPSYFDPDSRVVVARCMEGDNGRRFEEDYAWAYRDAEFIAAARTALPELIAEVRRLQYYEDWARRIAKLPCCNDCADHKTCDKKPKWGEVCAINCPLWRGPQPKKGDS